MKKFIAGLLTGYLLTSLFSISAPPSWFWGLCAFLILCLGTITSLHYRVNNDIHNGDF